MNIKRISGIALLLALVSNKPANAQIAPFKAGERVAFTGNSITDGGHYHSYIWLYYMTHFPGRRMEFFNAGIGGDDANNMYMRLDDDVFNRKPTVITLVFGMNDTGYWDFLKPKPEADSIAAARVAKAYSTFSKIQDRFKQMPEVRKIMIASSPYDETVKKSNNYFPGKSAAMARIAAFQEEAAKKNNWDFVDFFKPMTAINVSEQQKDSTFTLCGGDRIHPGNDGHLVMAYIFLKTQGLAKQDVANIEIDVTAKQVKQSVNCKLTGLSCADNKVKFSYLANSLPYPIDTIPRGWNETKRASDALKLIPFMNEFDREFLQVKGLDGSKTYALKIDGSTVGKWNGSSFAEGINMAAITTTPQYKQALAIMYLNEERWEIEKRFRQYYWVQFDFFRDKGLLFADNDVAMDTLNANVAKNGFLAGNKENYLRARFPEVRQLWRQEMDLLIDKIYTLNKPKEHVIEIVAE